MKKTSVVKKEKFGPTSLRDILWDNLQAVKEGTLDPRDCNAMTSTARAICSDAKLKLEALKFVCRDKKPTKKDVKQIGIL